jgi:RecB family exonuclease
LPPSVSLSLEPLEATRALLDVSVTERGAFRTCRRRWWLTTIENLEPKQRTELEFDFGSGIHGALETYRLNKGTASRRQKLALDHWARWSDNQQGIAVDEEEFQLALERSKLGLGMLENYWEYDKTAPVQLGTPLAVEGQWITKALEFKPTPPAGYPPDAKVQRHESGRMLVPIVHPDSKLPYKRDDGQVPFLTARIDLLTVRKTPKSGLWVVDYKTAGKAPSDSGLDFDDQVTGYCYVVWRWTGQIPRGVVFDYLIKQEPKEPRVVQDRRKGHHGEQTLSTAKDQLTTPNLYREALKEWGLMHGNKIPSTDHAACLGALLARGWDPFFRRFEVTRNIDQLMSFESRLVAEYEDMQYAGSGDPELLYPNQHTMLCPRCPVRMICLAMEDGSDVEDMIENDFVVGPDRKAKRG